MKTGLLKKIAFLAFLGVFSLNSSAQQTLDFETDENLWEKNYGVGTFGQTTESTRGVLEVEGTGKNPTLKRYVTAGNGIDGANSTYLKIVLKNTSTAKLMRLANLQTGSTTVYAWTAFKDISVGDTDYQTYYIDVSSAHWGSEASGEELNLQLQFRDDNVANVSGSVYIDEMTFYTPVDTFDGIIKNPGFDDVPGSFSPFTTDAKSYLTTSASSDETQSGSQSFKLAFSGPNSSDGGATYEHIQIYNAYRPNVGPYAIGSNPMMKAHLYIKYVNNEVGAPATKDIKIQGIFVIEDVGGGTGIQYRGVGVTKTLTNGGDWVLFEFERTETTHAFDNIFFRFPIYADVVGASEMQLGDELYIDTITSCVNCATLGTEQVTKDDSSVKLFPNPVSNVLNVKSANGSAVSKIEVYSILGKRVLESNIHALDVSSLSRGVYIAKIFSSNNIISTKRFVKE